MSLDDILEVLEDYMGPILVVAALNLIAYSLLFPATVVSSAVFVEQCLHTGGVFAYTLNQGERMMFCECPNTRISYAYRGVSYMSVKTKGWNGCVRK